MQTFKWSLLLMFGMVQALAQDGISRIQSVQGSPFSQADFVPDISLILDCSYLQRNITSERFANLHIPGFVHAHAHAASQDGFNLNYAELTFYSIVDPYFEVFTALHLSEEHFHLEEAYLLTRKFPAGFQLKAGKFLSSIARTNDVHAHYLDFDDRPLVHRMFFGDEGLNEIGARLTWVAPTDVYLLVGGEVLMGENEGSFGRTGFQRAGQGVDVGGVRGPGLVVGYVKSSIDIGDAAVLGGISSAYGKRLGDEGFSNGAANGTAVSGHSLVCGYDLTVKYLLDAIRYVSVQCEYLWRHTDGTRYASMTETQIRRMQLESRQSGFNVQAVMKFDLRLRGGVRVDYLDENRVTEAGLRLLLPQDLHRLCCMLEYNPTEFSRVRVQYNYDRSRTDEGNDPSHTMTIHELSLQVNLAIGAHGAHSF